MNLIAIKDEVNVFKPDGSNRSVKFGQLVGVYNSNLNNGFLRLATGETVDVDSVAIDANPNGSKVIEKQSYESNMPVQGATQKINNPSPNNTRKLIALALIAGGIYFAFNNRKAMGISLFVFGLIMLKRIK